jgi:hypothetical protein
MVPSEKIYRKLKFLKQDIEKGSSKIGSLVNFKGKNVVPNTGRPHIKSAQNKLSH